MTRRGLLSDSRIFANVVDETAVARRVPVERRRSPFPDAYFHLPRELAGEATAAGLRVEGVFGVEGPGWLLPHIDWDEATRARLIAAAREFESDPELVALSAHVLVVARR